MHGKHHLYKLLPLIVGTLLLIFAVIINLEFGLTYFNLKGYRSVLSSVVNFLSIVIGFYSAFYGMIISITKSQFFKSLQNSSFQNELPHLLFRSLFSAFACLILTIIMQVLVNYKENYILVMYYIWMFLVGVFITYSFQTSILSIAIIFGSEPKKKNIKKV